MAGHWLCSGDGSFKLFLRHLSGPGRHPHRHSVSRQGISPGKAGWLDETIGYRAQCCLFSQVLKHIQPNTLNLIEINAVPEQPGQHSPEERPPTHSMAQLNQALYVYMSELNL